MNVHSSPSDDLDPSSTGTAASLTNSTGTYTSTAGTLDTALVGGAGAAGTGKLSIVGKAVALAAEYERADMAGSGLRSRRTAGSDGIEDQLEMHLTTGNGTDRGEVTRSVERRATPSTRSRRRLGNDRRSSPPPLIDLASSSSEQGRRSYRSSKMTSTPGGYDSAGSGYDSEPRSGSSAADEEDFGINGHARRPQTSWTPAATPSRTDDRLASLLAKMTAPVEPSFGATPSRLSYAQTPARARGMSTTPTPAPAIQHSRLATRKSHASRTPSTQPPSGRLTWFSTSATPQELVSTGQHPRGTPSPEPIPEHVARRDGRSRHGFPPLSPGSKERILAAAAAVPEDAAPEDRNPDASRAEATGAISYDYDQTGHGTDDPPTPAPRLKPYMRSDPRTPRRAVKAASASKGLGADGSVRSPAPDGRSALFAPSASSQTSSAQKTPSSSKSRPLIDDYSDEEDSPPSPPLRATHLSHLSSSVDSRHGARVDDARHRERGAPEGELDRYKDIAFEENEQSIAPETATARRSPASPSSHRLRQYIRSSATPSPIVDSPAASTKSPESCLDARTSYASGVNSTSAGRSASVASPSRSRSQSAADHGAPTEDSAVASSSRLDVSVRDRQNGSATSSARREVTDSRLEASLSRSSLQASRRVDDTGRSSRRWFESSPPTGKTPRPPARTMPATPMPRFSTASRHSETPLPGSMDSFMRGLDDTRDDESELEPSTFDALAPVVEDTVADDESEGAPDDFEREQSPSMRAPSSFGASKSLEYEPEPSPSIRTASSRAASKSPTTMYATPTRVETTRGSMVNVREDQIPRDSSSSSRQLPQHSPGNHMQVEASETPRRTPKAPGAWQNSPSLRKVRFSPNQSSSAHTENISPANLSQRMLEQSTDMSLTSDMTTLSEAERFAEAKVEELKQQFQRQLNHVQALAESREPSKRTWLLSRLGVATQVLVGWSIFR